jgi:hypothetical protein
LELAVDMLGQLYTCARKAILVGKERDRFTSISEQYGKPDRNFTAITYQQFLMCLAN